MAKVARKKRVVKAPRKKVEKVVSSIPEATAEKNCTTCGSYNITSFGKKGTCFFHPKQRAGAVKICCKNWAV